ncbi:hypothetical protein NQZ68_030053 [Dissostichus eleginoides]|nr:hypothetical protein NQZ68_030053 [Dissostichus eleginoides]
MSGLDNMELSPPPSCLKAEYETIFTTDSLLFLHELISTFDEEVDQVLKLRVSRKAHLDLSGDLPSFLESSSHIRRDPAWRVLPVPPRLQRRHVDIGDLAPCDTQRFIQALQSPAQGIQTFLCVPIESIIRTQFLTGAMVLCISSWLCARFYSLCDSWP